MLRFYNEVIICYYCRFFINTKSLSKTTGAKLWSTIVVDRTSWFGRRFGFGSAEYSVRFRFGDLPNLRWFGRTFGGSAEPKFPLKLIERIFDLFQTFLRLLLKTAYLMCLIRFLLAAVQAIARLEVVSTTLRFFKHLETSRSFWYVLEHSMVFYSLFYHSHHFEKTD